MPAWPARATGTKGISMSLTHLKPSLASLALLAAAAGVAAAPPITLEVDARDVTRAIQHAHLVIPVHPGPLTLAYPKWIPGEHAPDGPITELVSLAVRAGRASPQVRRDQV